MRGGSWSSNQVKARAACRVRHGTHPDSGRYNVGLRVVCSSPIE